MVRESKLRTIILGSRNDSSRCYNSKKGNFKNPYTIKTLLGNCRSQPRAQSLRGLGKGRVIISNPCNLFAYPGAFAWPGHVKHQYTKKILPSTDT